MHALTHKHTHTHTHKHTCKGQVLWSHSNAIEDNLCITVKIHLCALNRFSYAVGFPTDLF